MDLVGVDYSLTSPGVCVHKGNTDWAFSNCKFYCLTTRKKLVFTGYPFSCLLYPEYSSQEERIDFLANWVIDLIPINANVAIENYSFGSRGGLAFSIGENTGVLKHLLWKNNHKFQLYSPGAIKKFATGSGAADKVKMHEAFTKETKCDIISYIPGTIGKSPLSDVIDAYYIGKFCYEQTRQGILGNTKVVI